MSKVQPVPRQLEVVKEILEAFDSGIKTICLSAPTGSGKSGIAWFSSIKSQMSAAVLSHQKVLQDQYEELLNSGDPGAFVTLKGADNYPCLIRKNTTAAYAPCSLYPKFKCEKMSSCLHVKTKKQAAMTNFLNTNYQLIWNMFDHQPEFKFGKDLYIYDEAHTIHQLYTDYRSPKVSQVDIKMYEKQLNYAEENDVDSLVHTAQRLLNELKTIDFRKTKDDEYLLDKIVRIFSLKDDNASALSSYISKNEDALIETGKINIIGALDKIECKSRTAFNIVKEQRPDFEDCVVELHQNDDKFNLTMTAFDIGKLFGKESKCYSDNKIFMSATILGAKNFLENLGLDKDSYHIIDLDSTFKPENRQVYLLPGPSINYKMITEQKEKLDPILEMTKELILSKAELGENGVIFTSSYDLTKIISNYLQMNLPEDKVEILFNTSSEGRTDVLESFKLKGSIPKVLISPSFFEGVNLNSDICRYSIIWKLPYKSLGSKYVKMVCEKNPDLYKIWTLESVIQGSGRGVRSEDDWCETYVFDGGARTLFKYNKKFVPKWFMDAVVYV